ncbi:MAG: TonB family protein [Cyanobacteria bacterium RM1_2_2]|nr:TonB family protein [Cyanobacteria bacterium RM1_2_2]
MSLQHYRSQLAARQNRRLMLYLSLAVGVHAAGLGLAHSEQWFSQKTPQTPTPIEFVNVEPSQTDAQQPPQSTKRRAQTNAVAGRNPNTEQPPQTGQTSLGEANLGETNLSETSSQSATSPALPTTPAIPSFPLPSFSPPSPLPSPSLAAPQPSLREIWRTEATNQEAIDQINPINPTEAAPSPIRPVPSPHSNLPVASSPQASVPERNPASQAGLPSASQLGNPLTASAVLERQGLTGQPNPNRAGDGASVDAVQDEVWGTYLSMLNQVVNQNWQRVAVAATRRTRIRFRVDRQGNLTELRLLQPSGDTAADEAAIQAVRASAPFAPLPQTASEEVLIVNFTFTQW